MAHVKAAGSTKNGRDSNPKYRGVKAFGWQTVVAGNIIVRQQGLKMEPGLNTYVGRDYTIHATVDGVVVFGRKRCLRFDGRKYLKTTVSVSQA
jgi:large subunit ribosomal protein L27